MKSEKISVSTESYPPGWCDPLQGTPTRTTGECVCKKDCVGAGCQRAQGFVWFAYTSCPSCKCVGYDRDSSKIPKNDKNDLSGNV